MHPNDLLTTALRHQRELHSRAADRRLVSELRRREPRRGITAIAMAHLQRSLPAGAPCPTC